MTTETKTLDASVATDQNPVYSDLRKRVTVYATESMPYHKPGEEVKAHEALAAVYVKRGWATTEKQEPKAKK